MTRPPGRMAANSVASTDEEVAESTCSGSMTVAISSMRFRVLCSLYAVSRGAIPRRPPARRQIGAAPIDPLSPKPGLDRQHRHQGFAHQCRNPGTRSEGKTVACDKPRLGSQPGERVADQGERHDDC